MAYYGYYQTLPSYGTQNFQFGSVPVPTYQPAPNWTGIDYFRAHYGPTDEYYSESIFGEIWDRVRDWIARGYGRDEASYWFSLVYSGRVSLATVSPSELGAAAGYAAWRQWASNHSFYQPYMAGDSRREREALVGIAISEAMRLFSYLGRPGDYRTREDMCEVAAGTADRIRLSHQRYDREAGYSFTGDQYGYGSSYGQGSYGGGSYGYGYPSAGLGGYPSTYGGYPSAYAGYPSTYAGSPYSAYGASYPTTTYQPYGYGGAYGY